MDTKDPIELARMLIDRHGVRAGAVVQERVNEAQHAGQTAELDLWRSVQAAVAELRRTAHQAKAPTVN